MMKTFCIRVATGYFKNNPRCLRIQSYFLLVSFHINYHFQTLSLNKEPVQRFDFHWSHRITI
jgi:hypothetical protein